MDLSAIALVVSGVSVLGQYFLLHTKLNDRISAIAERMTAVETKADLFWKVVEKGMSDMLIRPIHLEKDELLRRAAAHTINLEESAILWEMLENDLSHEEKGSGTYVATLFMLGRLNVIEHELKDRARPHVAKENCLSRFAAWISGERNHNNQNKLKEES